MYLGIDIGTSGVKVVLVNVAQHIVDQASMALSVSRPKPLWSEQNPQDWWDATSAAIKQLDPKFRSGVKAVGLSGQMHGATCLDEADAVLRPAILWNDGRSAAECEQMTSELPDLPHITGNLAMPGFTAPKLQWIRMHEPEIFAKIKKILLPKDYVRLRMSGDYASDMSDSAGTLWMDVANRDWSDDMLGLTGLSREHMPKLYEGSAATGLVSAAIAKEWGISRVPIAAGGGDNAAGAVGAGIISGGDGFISLGTSGVIFVADGQYRPNPAGAVHTFCHALPGLWHQMSVILSAASAIDFVARVAGFAQPSDIYAAAEARDKPSNGLFFLPYLSGERTPHNDPNATGAFFGLTHKDDQISMAQAALEGVAFALADGIDALRDAGAQIDTLSVIGGGTRSLFWGKILASAFNMPLHYRSNATVGPAFGAARLARLALNEDKIDDICNAPAIEQTIEPDIPLSEMYAESREVFRKLYMQTKSLR